MANTTEQTKKQPKTYTIRQVISSSIAWGIIAIIAVASAAFIVGWHSHQAHSQYIEKRVSSAVEASKE